MTDILEINFTEEERQILATSPWLQEVTERRQRATEGDEKAQAEITRNGHGREQILACHDSGQWTANHIRDGRQPNETHRAQAGLTEKIDQLQDGTHVNPLISVDARDRKRGICRAVRLLVVATMEQEIGKMAIQRGLTDADQMNDEALRARTQFNDGGESARARMDELSDLEDRLFGAYLDLEMTNKRPEMDRPLVRVALEYEIRILETLLGIYEENIEEPDDDTSDMLNKAKNTVDKLQILKTEITPKDEESQKKNKKSGKNHALLKQITALIMRPSRSVTQIIKKLISIFRHRSR